MATVEAIKVLECVSKELNRLERKNGLLQSDFNAVKSERDFWKKEAERDRLFAMQMSDKATWSILFMMGSVILAAFTIAICLL
jgi:hypothetical protein